MATRRRAKKIHDFGIALANERLTGLSAQLQEFRSARPLVKRSDGRYEGDILGFVKGLRLSAGVIHYLEQRLSQTDLEVSWGHLLNEKKQSCSPECDVIVHRKGYWDKWNGTDNRIMLFKFIEVGNARAVISCKSQLTSIDVTYPKDLKKFGVRKVFLFAESCSARRFDTLRRRAKAAGYIDLCCLYFTGAKGTLEAVDRSLWIEFGESVLKAVR
jgi:hypothetical protein